MVEPIQILVKKEELTLQGIDQYYVAIENEEWKLPTLLDLYENLDICQAIIFVNTVATIEFLREKLTEEDFTVDCIHSRLDMSERIQIMNNFRTGKSRILISSDLLARGIDITQVSLVINYDMPRQFSTYIHRIGRSGRYGKKGLAINFASEQDAETIRRLEEYYDTEI